MEKNKVLIEIAAQHPLINGKEPGIEFEARLIEGIKRYQEEEKKGNEPIIYIPGSLHSVKDKNGDWVTDEITLAEAGKRFLIKHGIKEEHIRANESNEKYKKDGVYNSGDECFVAGKIAEEENIKRVISVVSPVQVYRKALFYIGQGYSPEMYGVGVKDTYHNYVGEAFWSLYITYFIDHTWQDSFLAFKTREERNKEYEVTSEIQEIIEKGIYMPEDVKARKQTMMSLYNNAKKLMEEKEKTGKERLITIETLNEETFMKIKELMDNNEEEINIGIILENKDEEQVIEKYFGNSIKNVRGFKSFEELLEYYKISDNKSWEHITTSPKTMAEAIKAIKGGCLPVLYSIPSEENNAIEYIDEISKLYDELLDRDKKLEVPNKNRNE